MLLGKSVVSNDGSRTAGLSIPKIISVMILGEAGTAINDLEFDRTQLTKGQSFTRSPVIAH